MFFVFNLLDFKFSFLLWAGLIWQGSLCCLVLDKLNIEKDETLPCFSCLVVF